MHRGETHRWRLWLWRSRLWCQQPGCPPQWAAGTETPPHRSWGMWRKRWAQLWCPLLRGFLSGRNGRHCPNKGRAAAPLDHPVIYKVKPLHLKVSNNPFALCLSYAPQLFVFWYEMWNRITCYLVIRGSPPTCSCWLRFPCRHPVVGRTVTELRKGLWKSLKST